MKQEIVIDVILYADLAKAGASDDIADTVDYRRIRNRVIKHVRPSGYRLIEALADNVARLCLEERGVQRVEVCVAKPGALTGTDSVAVRVTRDRPPDG